MAVEKSCMARKTGGRLAVVAGLGLLLGTPAAADPVFLEYRCLLGGDERNGGLFLGWEGREADRLLAPKPAGPDTDRLVPRRLRLPLYTAVPAAAETTGPATVSHARGRGEGPRFTVGIGVGVTIGSALLYVQLGT